MFAPARKAAKAQLSKGLHKHGSLQLSSHSLPKSYSLAQLYNELVDENENQNSDHIQDILILNSCLSGSERLQREDEDEEYLEKLLSWISKAILPTSTCIAQDEMPEAKPTAVHEKAILLAQQKGIFGLHIFQDLLVLDPQLATPLSPEILISILTFTSTRDPWTTPSSLSTTQSLLSLPQIKSQIQTPDFIPKTLLQNFIRPLFSASKPDSVTAAGRKAMPSSAPPKRHDFVNERNIMPWRYEVPYAVAVFEWAVENANAETIQTTWPLIIPPLLTLLDTPSIPFLTRGLFLTSSFFPKLATSPSLLTQTGLSSVFEDAILPTLLYLPSITPLSDTLLLLPVAYTAVFALYSARFEAKNTDPRTNSQNEIERVKFLDRVLRKAILPAYFHASQHPDIVSLLIDQLGILVGKQGIHATKHLKDIIPILSSVLTDPFGGAGLQGLIRALKTLQVVILNCWVRVGESVWRREVVRGLVLCWRSAQDGEGMEGDEEVRGRVREEVKATGRMLVKAVEGAVDMREELMPLLEVDGEIREVFGMQV